MMIRPLICVPTYNNPESINEVVHDILAHCSERILILDDGSDRPVSSLLAKDERISIIRLDANLGKGNAIQECIKYAASNGHTHIITIDGDGQHKAHDLKNIISEIEKFPWALIIGKRKFSGEFVPSSSQFGRKFSNFWVKYQTDMIVEDSQSGFRAYPIFHVQEMSFFTKRYDFEIEILIRLIWKKVKVREVEIDVYYPPPHERVSHFNKFKDNVKISTLNTVLVILSLLHSNTSPLKASISLGLGAMTGVLPIYGFQMYLAGVLAFIFRLNFPLMFLGQQVSIPPLIPLWTWLSLKIGSFVLKRPLELTLDEAIYQAPKLILLWITGSVLLGLALGVFLGCTTFFLSPKKQKKAWTGKDRGGKFGNWFMEKVALLFGPRVAYFFLWFICPYFYIFAPRAVIAQNQFFRRLNPELGFWKRQLKVVNTFYHLGMVLIDNVYTRRKGISAFNVNRNGKENTYKGLDGKKGLVLVGAHVGAWMFASKVFDRDEDEGRKLPVNVVEFEVGGGQNASNKIQSKSLTYITNDEENPIFRINQALTDNEVVMFMADRPVSRNVELIPFLGKLAPFDIGSFRIALAKKSAIAFSFGFKASDKTYELYITKPIFLENEMQGFGREEKIMLICKSYTDALETLLREYPYQWFNFFPFWSSLPYADLAED